MTAGATVVCETIIAASANRVFDALTDPKQLLAWWVNEPFTKLVEIEMDPSPGGQWRFRWQSGARIDYGEIGEQLSHNERDRFEAWGRIVESVRPRVLVWSWSASWHADPSRVTTVRWDLEPVPGGTRVRVTHSGLEGESVAERDYRDGWRQALGLLAAFLQSAPH